ncbi:unnamed protein product [Clonostachys rhizophaga]|uniref:Protein-arginine deiminase C-terminal domain-containing protein n=1 Tax=Clonostachys rhizophaga TaxID=160324 RepID=A0A9N9VYR8_9HYPO|nr:unnamed protein product [Clonostachys rhizophaga]
MGLYLQQFLLATCTHAAFTLAAQPQILADTNRDGVVNDLDINAKQTWTDQRGAIFIPNIGDVHQRCSAFDVNGKPLGNKELSMCNDASGDTLVAPEYAAPVRTSPISNLSADATGRIYTLPESTLGRVRIFWNQAGFENEYNSSWRLTDSQFTFNATSIGGGLELAVDATELVTGSTSWDGRVSIVYEITEANVTRSDSVALQQAPVLFHHHLQDVETVLTMDANDTTSSQARFVQSIQDTLEHIPGGLPLRKLEPVGEPWAQDFMEPGYVSMPGPNGTISIRVLVRSAQSTRISGRKVFKELRGPGVGGHQLGLGSGFGHEEINSGGNIETIPPYTSRSGRHWAQGRIITAKHFDKYPAESMIDFMVAQEAQSPLFLEAGWLAVGHVDEFVQFLPSDNHLGFTIAVGDAMLGLEVLQGAQADGHGSAIVNSFDGDMTPYPNAVFLDPKTRNKTIDSLLSNQDFIQANKYGQSYVQQNLNLLLQEIPLDESEVLRLPVLWRDVTYPWPLTLDGIPPRVHRTIPGERQLVAYMPAAVNGLVLGSDYISAKPWGPLINGQDPFEQAIRDVYGRVNMTVHFVDDYMSHHVQGGEVHCGTNSLRDTSIPWWST